MITLVGAGPGPGLLTQKGWNALKAADVILYDDLLDESLLSDPALGGAEKIYVGKRSGEHSASQEEINALLIEQGRTGKNVVRLKGGDSFVFGRGGEEALALQEAGLPFESVPGVTSAVAVPEDFGIPVTHRGMSRSFTVITGHTKDDADGTVGGESFEALAKLKGTLVFLMGLRNLSSIVDGLLANGKDPETPAAVLSSGFTENAARYDGTLSTIAEAAKDAETPAILVVGEVASFRLSPRSVSVIGTEHFCEKFRARCPDAVTYPLVEVVPTEGALAPYGVEDGFPDVTWIAFLSANALRLFFEQVGDVRKLSHLKFACVGSATAEALQRYGFSADFVPSVCDRATLLKELPGTGRVLLLGARKADGTDTDLPDRFTSCGLYETKTKAGDADLFTRCAVFASAGGVHAFFENDGHLNGAVPICIGKPTAKALAAYGVTGHIAPDATIDGVLEALRSL